MQDVQEWPEILQSVTPEEIVAAGREVFDRRNAVTGYLTKPDGPEGNIAPVDTSVSDPEVIQ